MLTFVRTAKFCPKCGTLQPGAGGAAPVQVVAKRAAGVAGKFDIDFESLRTQFEELCKKDTEAQTEFFLKTFIMALGDDWKNLLKLQKEFTKACGGALVCARALSLCALTRTHCRCFAMRASRTTA